MSTKHYAVVWLPNPQNADVTIGEIRHFDTYADAFDCLVEDASQPVPYPKRGEQPLRIQVDNYYKELWIISRKEQETDGLFSKN
jgi:hypothetical protein